MLMNTSDETTLRIAVESKGGGIGFERLLVAAEALKGARLQKIMQVIVRAQSARAWSPLPARRR